MENETFYALKYFDGMIRRELYGPSPEFEPLPKEESEHYIEKAIRYYAASRIDENYDKVIAYYLVGIRSKKDALRRGKMLTEISESVGIPTDIEIELFFFNVASGDYVEAAKRIHHALDDSFPIRKLRSTAIIPLYIFMELFGICTRRSPMWAIRDINESRNRHYWPCYYEGYLDLILSICYRYGLGVFHDSKEADRLYAQAKKFDKYGFGIDECRGPRAARSEMAYFMKFIALELEDIELFIKLAEHFNVLGTAYQQKDVDDFRRLCNLLRDK